jgi:hypothetical protein
MSQMCYLQFRDDTSLDIFVQSINHFESIIGMPYAEREVPLYA